MNCGIVFTLALIQLLTSSAWAGPKKAIGSKPKNGPSSRPHTDRSESRAHKEQLSSIPSLPRISCVQRQEHVSKMLDSVKVAANFVTEVDKKFESRRLFQIKDLAELTSYAEAEIEKGKQVWVFSEIDGVFDSSENVANVISQLEGMGVKVLGLTDRPYVESGEDEDPQHDESRKELASYIGGGPTNRERGVVNLSGFDKGIIFANHDNNGKSGKDLALNYFFHRLKLRDIDQPEVIFMVDRNRSALALIKASERNAERRDINHKYFLFEPKTQQVMLPPIKSTQTQVKKVKRKHPRRLQPKELDVPATISETSEKSEQEES